MARLPAPLRPLWPRAKRAYTVGTRVAAPVTRQLSRLGGGHVPRRAVRYVDQVAAPGTTCIAVAAHTMDRRPATGLPAHHWAFDQACKVEVPRAVVAALPDARVLGRHGAVVTADGVLVDELSPYFSTTTPWQHPLFLHPFPPAPVPVPGALGLLAGVGDFNYCHFLFDIFPRHALFGMCPGLPRPERWYVPLRYPFQRELVAAMGIDPGTVVDSAVTPHVRAELLVAASHADFPLDAPAWTVALLRGRLLGGAPGVVPGRRIYVPRTGRRNNRIIRNELAVRQLLDRRGFVTVDPGQMSLAEQIDTFATAEVVVAPHGAALANLAFASPGARVVELFAPDYVKTCYWALTQHVPGLEYRYLVGEGRPRGAAERAMMGVASDITVDTGKLATLLDT